MDTPAQLRWTKCPPDGTNYAYWEAPGGWLICTKPRFLPRIGYALQVPASWGAGSTLRFDTLALAQAAAQWPREQLLEHLRRDYEHFVRLIAGAATPEALLASLHAQALDEDEERRRRAAA